MLQELTKLYYEPENQSKCYKQVWRKYIRSQFGICYRAYLRYLKVKTDEQEVKPVMKTIQLSLFD